MAAGTVHPRDGSTRKIVWGTVVFLWLLVLLATQLTTEVSWSEAIAYCIMVTAPAGLYELARALRPRPASYQLAVAAALGTGFLLGAVNGAVGIIGSENQPANLLYLGVIAIGLLGAVLARFRPRGMSRALLGAAIAQVLVPVIALMLWPQISWGGAGMVGVFALNAFFAGMFAGSAWLFGRAAIVDSR
jgi:hypothetical protein